MFSNLNLSKRLYTPLILWLIGALTVGINITLMFAGIPYPSSGGRIISPEILLYLGILTNGFLIAEILTMLWLSVKIKSCFNTMSSTKLFLIIFGIFCAIEELFIRLPLTAGYAADQKFAFVWLYQYAPSIVETLCISILVFAYVSLRKYCYSKTVQNWMAKLTRFSKETNSRIIDALLVFLVIALFMVIKLYLMEHLLVVRDTVVGYLVYNQYLALPNPAGVLDMPYPWQVNAIAIGTFIEPIIGFFVIGIVLYHSGYQKYWKLSLMTFWVIILLTLNLYDFIVTMIVSDLDIVMRVLSVSQFTLQYVFIAAMLPLIIFHLKKKSANKDA